MKKFTKFTTFFVMFVTSLFSCGCLYFAISDFVELIKAENEIKEAIYFISCSKNLIAAIIIITIGFVLTSIVYLLIKIANNTSVKD